MTPRSRSCEPSCDIKLTPPRTLKAPTGWWFSCLTKTSAWSSSFKPGYRRSGVTLRWGAIRRRASSTSARVGTCKSTLRSTVAKDQVRAACESSERLISLDRAHGRANVLAGTRCSARLDATAAHRPPVSREPLTGADDEECDRDVLAGHGDERERMEELVIAEQGRERVRPAPHIDDRPGRVEEPSDAEQRDRRRIKTRGELRQKGDSCPAERNAEHGRDPLRCFDPGELEDDRGSGGNIDDDEGDQAPRSGQHEQTDGRVRTGDQEVNARVVDSPHPQPRARRPGHPVVKRTRAKADRDRAAEHGSRDMSSRAVCTDDQERSNDERDRESSLVKHTAQKRPRQNRLGRRRIRHTGTINGPWLPVMNLLRRVSTHTDSSSRRLRNLGSRASRVRTSEPWRASAAGDLDPASATPYAHRTCPSDT